jgi:hypothetical protein
MACEAVIGCLGFGVAGYTPTHCHLAPRPRWRPLALSDLSVAGVARDLPQYHMTPMREEDMIWLLVKALPGDRLSFLLKLSDLLLFLAFCNGLFVTLQTRGYVRHSGEGLLIKIGMASDAFHSLLLMFFVIKRNGLFSLGAKT